MFIDILTPAELGCLRSKLYSAGHQAAMAAYDLGQQAFKVPALSEQHTTIWTQRQRFVDFMDEMYRMAESAELGHPDALTCPRSGAIVTVMVAAGNEQIPVSHV